MLHKILDEFGIQECHVILLHIKHKEGLGVMSFLLDFQFYPLNIIIYTFFQNMINEGFVNLLLTTFFYFKMHSWNVLWLLVGFMHCDFVNKLDEWCCILQSVEGMKVVCHELAQATSDPEGSAMDDVVKDADRLVSCLANKATTKYFLWFQSFLIILKCFKMLIIFHYHR